jgi:hypothetical protein
MNNKSIIKIISSVGIFLILFPLMAGAAGLVPCGRGINDSETPNINESLPCTVCDLLVLAQNVLTFAFEIAFLIVVGFIVYGGFRWIFSLGKEENLKAGQKIITNAIIGIVIILSAWIIVNTVFWFIAQAGGTEEYIGTWYKIKCP